MSSKIRWFVLLLISLSSAAALGQSDGAQTGPGFASSPTILPTLQGSISPGTIQHIDPQPRLWPQLRVLRASPASADPIQIVKRALAATRYELTPGDYFKLSLKMLDETSVLTLVLQENYDLECPYIGTLNVQGMCFTDFRKMVVDRLKKLLPLAAYVSLTLDSPALFDVQVSGEAQSPGVVTACPLARVSDVVAMAQGLRLGASIRRIILVHEGQRRTVDLYLYGLTGDCNQNPCVRPGDQIIVPRAQTIVVLGGYVQDPGYYELVPGETLRDLIDYSGGILADAVTNAVELNRLEPNGLVQDLLIDLNTEIETPLLDGDFLRVNFDSTKQY
jgi:protein involved in polysaccharide export with SLBB domain